MMPKLDGFGLLRPCATIAALRDVPVVLLSARAGEEARIEGLNAGADDYLVKPFTARELLARVGALLELRRMRRDSEERRRRELEEAARQKDEFLAMLAHELRNPLAPIRNAGELLSRKLPADAPHAHRGAYHRAAGDASDAAGRRPARRLAHHAGTHRAAHEARPRWPTSWRARSRPSIR